MPNATKLPKRNRRMTIVQGKTVMDIPVVETPLVEVVKNRSLAFTLRKLLREKVIAAPVFEYVTPLETGYSMVQKRLFGASKRSSSGPDRASLNSEASEDNSIFEDVSKLISAPPRKRYLGVVDVRDIVVLLLNERDESKTHWWNTPLINSMLIANRGVQEAINLSGMNDLSKLFVSRRTPVKDVYEAFISSGAQQVYVVRDYSIIKTVTQNDFFTYLWREFLPYKDHPKVKKYMESSLKDLQLVQYDVVAIKGSASLRDALLLMTDKRVSAIPVLEEDGRMMGVLSASDIKQLYTNVESTVLETLRLDEIVDIAKLDQPVSAFIESETRRTSSHWESVLCKEDDTLAVTIEKLLRPRAQRVFLLNDQGHPTGVTTLLDVMDLLHFFDPTSSKVTKLKRARSKTSPLRRGSDAELVTEKELNLDSEAVLKGFLEKRGKIVKNWKRRLFVLREREGQFEISYYAAVNSNGNAGSSSSDEPQFRLKRKLPLGRDFVVRVADDEMASGKPNVFSVLTSRRSLRLSAATSDERESWASLLARLSEAHVDNLPHMPVGALVKKHSKAKAAKSHQRESDAKPRESDAKPRESDAKPRESDAKPTMDDPVDEPADGKDSSTTEHADSVSTLDPEDAHVSVPAEFNGFWQYDTKRSDPKFNETFGKKLGTPWVVRKAAARTTAKRTIEAEGIRWTQSTSVAAFTFNRTFILDGSDVIERHPFDGTTIRVRHKLAADGTVNSVAWYEKHKLRHDIQRKLIDNGNVIQFREVITPSPLPSLDDMERDPTFTDEQMVSCVYYKRTKPSAKAE